MRALVKAKAEKGIWMEQIAEPSYGPNDVMIRMKKTAICGTDMHIWHWDEWAQRTIKVPMAVGHEYAGEIVALGSEVRGLAIGDRVSGEGHITCGHCRNCRAGRRHLCRNTVGVGVNRPGCFAEYMSLPASNVFKLSDAITDVNPYRLDLARRMGASRALDVRTETLDEAMKSLQMEEGFDVGLEMSGVPSAFREMLRTMHHGGNVALLGLMPQDTGIHWDEVIFKGLVLKGVYGREMFETWYKMSSMLQSGLDISGVITHRLPVEEFQLGFETMASGHSGKVILDWSALA